jgi:hypothetical protein
MRLSKTEYQLKKEIGLVDSRGARVRLALWKVD